jgi:hypothetical protein
VKNVTNHPNRLRTKIAVTFHVPFGNVDYASWARDCGAEFVEFEPSLKGGFDLQVRGSREAIKCLAGELGSEPNMAS